jgi:hypothetical protein
MGWARLDDGFDDHSKIVALMDEEDGLAAIGLWTVCLTWAHRNTRKPGKVPGRLPAGLLRRYGGAAGKHLADLLVLYGLWELTDTEGWSIHDFDRYLPKDDLRAKRAEAGRRGAQARWQKNGKPDPAPVLPSDLPSEISRTQQIATRLQDEIHHTQILAEKMQQTDAMHVSPATDGNLPSTCHELATDVAIDLPSTCHDVAIEGHGNEIAKDGSRVYARRVRVTPVPVREELSRRKTAQPAREDVEQVCRHLADCVEANGSKRPRITQKWRDEARLLIDLDGRSVEQIIRAIDWCQSDSFWRANVLSMPTLREKYDQLRLKAQAQRVDPGRQPPPAAPAAVPLDEQCPNHRGYRSGKCRECRAEALAKGVPYP